MNHQLQILKQGSHSLIGMKFQYFSNIKLLIITVPSIIALSTKFQE